MANYLKRKQRKACAHRTHTFWDFSVGGLSAALSGRAGLLTTQNPVRLQGSEVPQAHCLSSSFQLRSALDKTEELEVSNGHLVKRLEKMKANRNALLSQQ